ncbi:Hypothetical predicted protein [Pelobates cultripes]|uniref:Uncharacterized protein n=1 Tax=Pelobates cultripes TaxID=61616 RepID=A0AAD1TA89_PELCU|nr:Hypothetical predicted protein [Pelobates cultripes]
MPNGTPKRKARGERHKLATERKTAPNSTQHPPQTATAPLGRESLTDWLPAATTQVEQTNRKALYYLDLTLHSFSRGEHGLYWVPIQRHGEAAFGTGLGQRNFLAFQPLSRKTWSPQRLDPPRTFHSQPGQRLHEMAH